MNIRYIKRIRLDLFDGEGGAPAAAGAAGEGGEAAPAPALPEKKQGKFDNIIFGKQAQAAQPDAAQSTAEQTQSGAEGAKDPAADRRKRFRDMIDGEFKAEFTEEFNKAFNRRYKDAKLVEQRAQNAEARLKEMKDVVDLMNARYSISDGNLKDLKKAIEDDIEMWNQAGAKEGLTGEQKRAFTMSQMKVSQLEEAERSRKGSEQAQRQLNKWSAEAVQMAEKFPGGRLVFDTVGKFGRDVLMKGTLKNMGMNDVSGLFYAGSASDLEGWSPKVKLVSRKSYMQGYYSLDDPNIRGIHRFLAKLCDNMAKMYINRMEFTSEA